MRKKQLLIGGFFCLILLLYLAAALLTFRQSNRLGALFVFSLTAIGGLALFGLGYVSIIGFGGKSSLNLFDFFSKFNGSKHLIKLQETNENRRNLANFPSIIYMPAIVFLVAMAIALNVHYLDLTFPITFRAIPTPAIQTILTSLDIFLKPTSIGSFKYSLEIIPIMVFFVFCAGIVPSIVSPYFRKFKVTGVNSVPFHKATLLNLIGAAFGITVVLSLVNVIYGFLIGSQPRYYSFLLPALLGFSLQYFLGLYSGRDKAEQMIEINLKTVNRKHVFIGEVKINDEQKKPES